MVHTTESGCFVGNYSYNFSSANALNSPETTQFTQSTVCTQHRDGDYVSTVHLDGNGSISGSSGGPLYSYGQTREEWGETDQSHTSLPGIIFKYLKILLVTEMMLGLVGEHWWMDGKVDSTIPLWLRRRWLNVKNWGIFIFMLLIWQIFIKYLGCIQQAQIYITC